jgi:hypothetical protein
MATDGAPVDHPSLARPVESSVLVDELAIVLEEARTAEAAAMIDLDTARAELRSRLQPLLAERRRMLDAQLDQAREDASLSVQAAERAASVMLAQAAARNREALRLRDEAAVAAREAEMAAEPVEEPIADEPVEDLVVEEPVVEPVEDLVVEEPVVEDVLVVEEPRAVVMPVLESSVDDAIWARTTAATLAATAATAVQPDDDVAVPTTNIVIDAEAFARVFATTVAALLQDRPPVVVHAPAAPVVAPAPAKQSFWSNARHADVLLMGLATVIVITVLAAWLA